MDRTDNKDYSVSVVIPAYNAEKYIGRAIDSVLAQTRRPDEVIVVDDGSTDGTAEVIRSYGSNVRYIGQENGGASVARNSGIEAASSQWIAFLDADDEWLCDKLRIQMEYLEGHQELMWMGGNYFVRSAGESDLQKVSVDREIWQSYAGQKDYIEGYFDAYIRNIGVLTSTVIVKKSLLEEVGLFRVGQMWAQDTDLFWRLAYRQQSLGYVIDPVAIYSHELPTSITMLNKGRIGQRCELIERHLDMAASEGMYEDFLPCALSLLNRWLRQYFQEHSTNIGEMLDRFDNILPRTLKTEIRLRIAYPRLAGGLFRLYFALKNLIIRGKGRE